MEREEGAWILTNARHSCLCCEHNDVEVQVSASVSVRMIFRKGVKVSYQVSWKDKELDEHAGSGEELSNKRMVC